VIDAAESVRPRVVRPTMLKAMRALAGWSQRELARQAGVHVQTVKYWERQSFICGHAPDRFWEAFERAGIGWPDNLNDLSTRLMRVPEQHQTSARCGAMTRRGTACAAKPLAGKNRCKFHGGMSTGPRSEEGKARIADAQRRRWKLRRFLADWTNYRGVDVVSGQ
jgi:hypothetical protein